MGKPTVEMADKMCSSMNVIAPFFLFSCPIAQVCQQPRKHALARGITEPYIHDYFRSKSLSALLSSVGMEPPCLPPPPSIQGFILETNSCQ